jgi:hypothetical protein
MFRVFSSTTKKIFKKSTRHPRKKEKTTQRTPSTNDDVGTTTREEERGRGDAADDGESFETTRPHRLPFVFFISGGERVFGTIRESDFTEHFDDDKNERVFSR